MMKYKYVAKIYFGSKEISNQSGDEVEALYVWMLTQANGNPGDIHGEIIDNEIGQVVRRFRKSPSE
ncbi:MAG: hypothetical protein ACYCQI_16470 [Gammaproteobacteria bacterium]